MAIGLGSNVAFVMSMTSCARAELATPATASAVDVAKERRDSFMLDLTENRGD
jgi:hypothetical protein